jgi:uncharacterized membrane protein
MKPSLVESSIRHTLARTLQECHRFKLNHYNVLFNVSLFVVFCILLSLLLVVKYRGKLTENEKQEKENLKKEYILSRIQNFQDANKQISQSLISGLPSW